MSNPEERACGRHVGPDCKYLTTTMHYWCTNKACCHQRGTSIPGVVSCPYYRPVDKPAYWWENFLLTGSLLFYVVLTIILTIILARYLP